MSLINDIFGSDSEEETQTQQFSGTADYSQTTGEDRLKDLESSQPAQLEEGKLWKLKKLDPTDKV